MEESLRRKIEDILPEIRGDAIAPPYQNYSFFVGGDLYPFRHDAATFDVVNAWWLIEAATLAYSEEDFARERFVKPACRRSRSSAAHAPNATLRATTGS
jgi:hypothetical protein